MPWLGASRLACCLAVAGCFLALGGDDGAPRPGPFPLGAVKESVSLPGEDEGGDLRGIPHSEVMPCGRRFGFWVLGLPSSSLPAGGRGVRVAVAVTAAVAVGMVKPPCPELGRCGERLG